MNDWVYAGFDETYRELGVAFDKIYYESETYLEGKKKVEEGLEKGLFFRKDDNSVWADLTNEGLDQKLLLRSDGTSVYMTQDIGTAEMRYEDYPIDKMIYVVGNEQNYHFQVLSILLDRLGFKWGKDLVHFSYGMVELPNGKMKSREGTVVDADELIAGMIADARQTSDELGKFDDMTEEEKQHIARIVGMGALKYFILKVDARKNMLFNPEESIDFNGNTGPFIQYTHARIRSILRKAEAEGTAIGRLEIKDLTLSEKEISLIQKLNDFPNVILQAGKDYSPSGIANYCYELTKEFNQFYHDHSILGAESEEAKQFRLVLARNVAKIERHRTAAQPCRQSRRVGGRCCLFGQPRTDGISVHRPDYRSASVSFRTDSRNKQYRRIPCYRPRIGAHGATTYKKNHLQRQLHCHHLDTKKTM